MDYKNTLNLPRTDFGMKADLVAREPQRLARWEADGLYAQIQKSRAGRPRFVLHDGPPFANGDVHVGTALNKVLKDIIVKYKSLRGFDAPYVPGWDCHGLPIEFKVTQDMRKGSAAAPAVSAGASPADFGPAAIRSACDAYARKYIDLQRTQFKRLGVFGDWANPYLTLNKEYEADELRLFADLVAQGFVYRGKKPVYWSIPCRTALAEAEVEYADHVSQSVYVKFKLVGEPNTFLLIWTTTPWTLPANLAVAFNPDLFYSRIHADGNVYLVCNPLLEHVTQKCGWAGNYQIERTVSAEELESLSYEHPFCARTGQLFSAAFVTADSGTGFVHIAPGHGADDYNLGRSEGLPIYSPVNDDGCLAITGDLPAEQQMPAALLGKSILEKHGRSDANDAVLHELRSRNALAHQENYHHSYPHCWRSKTPIIFRAMDQWFIKVDHAADGQTFRDRALAEINRVQWIPDWGKNRIEGAVKSRPDWCISRQRSWGVPIPAFYDDRGEPILDAAIVRKAADLFEQHGSNVWFEKTAAELWALCRPADWTGREAAAKSSDTLDVWIDSGSSSRAVLMRRDELSHSAFRAPRSALDWQADVYLEGSDQHRGWFQSSLLLSLAGNGAAPFKTVLTHGFMVDEDREKISKSKQEQAPIFVPAEPNYPCYFDVGEATLPSLANYLMEQGVPLLVKTEPTIETSSSMGEESKAYYRALHPKENLSEQRGKQLIEGFLAKPKSGYVKPQTADRYVNEYGADVLRLWVASQDYRTDITVSEERLKKVGETYRGIRNALRYQLSNLFDFDPAKHTVPDDQLTKLDRWVLGEFAKLEEDVRIAYEGDGEERKGYEFHVVYQRVSQFVAVELSSQYHDFVKDRLYTGRYGVHARRSTQTALHRMVTRLCQMLAPVLAFTADEAWEFIPGKPTFSVHLSEWNPVRGATDSKLTALFTLLFHIRSLCQMKFEKERQAKTFGKSLEAEVELGLPPEIAAEISSERELLQEMLNISHLSCSISEKGIVDPAARAARGQKCERCWHTEPTVGANADHPTLCPRCVEAVTQWLSEHTTSFV